MLSLFRSDTKFNTTYVLRHNTKLFLGPGRSCLELVVRKHNETKITLAPDPAARSAQLTVKKAYWHCSTEGSSVSSTYATASDLIEKFSIYRCLLSNPETGE